MTFDFIPSADRHPETRFYPGIVRIEMKFPKRRKFWKHTLVFLFTRSEIFRFVSRRIEILLFLFHLLVKNRSFHFLRINLDLNERVLRLNCKKIQLLPPPLAFVSSHNFGRKNQQDESRDEKKGSRDKALEVGLFTRDGGFYFLLLLSPSPLPPRGRSLPLANPRDGRIWTSWQLLRRLR